MTVGNLKRMQLPPLPKPSFQLDRVLSKLQKTVENNSPIVLNLNEAEAWALLMLLAKARG